jgi:hypothetical protein
MDFLSHSGRVGGTTQTDVVGWSSDFMLLQGEHPTETPLKIWARSIVGLKVTELLSPYSSRVGGTAPTEHRQLGVVSPYYSKEHILQKVL